MNSLHEVQSRIHSACARAKREVATVALLGASKSVETSRLESFYAAGLRCFGENYIQEGVQKVLRFEEKKLDVNWHFIGALQSNKAREAVAHFELIHSVDRLSLARELDKEAAKIGKVQRVLVQVNLENEASKAGVAPEKLAVLLQEIGALQNLQLEGLMSLPPFCEDAEAMRPFHRQLRQLRDSMAPAFPTLAHLSMGMSHDFEVAIEEGATLVRVGTALFGARS